MRPTDSAPSTTATDQLNQQVCAAQHAFDAAADTAPSRRAQWLEAIAQAVQNHSDELVSLAHTETHLPLPRLHGELQRTVFQLRLYADEITHGRHLDITIDHADPDWGMGPRPDIRRMDVPLGVVGVFGASNFPFAFSVIGGDTASALAAGCAVVHKIHDGHRELADRTAHVVADALREAGAPDGIFSTVTGLLAGQELVTHPWVKAIGFTGSATGGRALYDLACQRPVPIPFFGELGSMNPVFVTHRAWQLRRDDILAGYTASVTQGMGQFCTKPGLLFTPVFERADVADTLRGLVAQAPRAPLLTPQVRSRYDEVLAATASLPGIDTLIAGDSSDAPHPTVLVSTSDVFREDPASLEQEIFGPASVIIQYRCDSELAQLASLLGGQLSATVHAEPDEQLSALTSRLRETGGRLVWGGWPTGVTVSPAQHHGGPYPATTAPSTTSVGTAAIRRFLRPVAYQSFPQEQLPPPLQDANPWMVTRRVDERHASAHGRASS